MYYEATLTRMGLDDNGKEKRFTEKYLVDALSITEAITRFESEISSLYPDHETKAVKRTNYYEVLTEESTDSRYFHITYNVITMDDTSGKEKKSPVAILIQADNFDDAKSKYAEAVKGYLTDIELVKLTETKILDYFPAKLG